MVGMNQLIGKHFDAKAHEQVLVKPQQLRSNEE
jgi:hypothetical protein